MNVRPGFGKKSDILQMVLDSWAIWMVNILTNPWLSEGDMKTWRQILIHIGSHNVCSTSGPWVRMLWSHTGSHYTLEVRLYTTIILVVDGFGLLSLGLFLRDKENCALMTSTTSLLCPTTTQGVVWSSCNSCSLLSLALFFLEFLCGTWRELQGHSMGDDLWLVLL